MAADEYETPEELAKVEDEARRVGAFLPQGSKPIDPAESRMTWREIKRRGGLTAMLNELLSQPQLPLRRTR